jgi:hypothetical protein
MPRGRTRGDYVSDILAATFTIDVPDDQFADANRGWAAAPVGQIRRPSRLRPRHVEGLSPTTGRRARALIATTTSALWARTAVTFSNIANDGTTDTYDVTGLIGEAVTL